GFDYVGENFHDGGSIQYSAKIRLFLSGFGIFIGFVLGGEIGDVAGDAVFVWASINLRGLGEVAVWRRGGRLPLQGGGLPWIIGSNFRAVADAREKVNDEWNLGEAQTDRGPKNVSVHAHNLCAQTADGVRDIRGRISGPAVRHAAQ